MASKRNVRKKSCDGKVRHLSRESAVTARRHVRKSSGEWLNEYKCKFCNGWHFGHPPWRTQQAINASYGRAH
jgi:hypothetical protein